MKYICKNRKDIIKLLEKYWSSDNLLFTPTAMHISKGQLLTLDAFYISTSSSTFFFAEIVQLYIFHISPHAIVGFPSNKKWWKVGLINRGPIQILLYKYWCAVELAQKISWQIITNTFLYIFLL